MNDTATLIPLTLLPRELVALVGRSPSYQVVYHRMVSGVFPANKVADRWYVRRTDLPVIAGALGLTASEAA